MLRFEEAYDSFSKFYNKKINSPERLLFLFVKSRGCTRIGPLSDFVTIRQFSVNDGKYSLDFRAAMENQTGSSSANSGKASSGHNTNADCSHLRTPHARNVCVTSKVK